METKDLMAVLWAAVGVAGAPFILVILIKLFPQICLSFLSGADLSPCMQTLGFGWFVFAVLGGLAGFLIRDHFFKK